MGLEDLSPFCIKLQSYLKLAKLPFETQSGNPQSSPKGKLPYITFRGKKYSDTYFIIQMLNKTFELDLDQPLTREQRIWTATYRSSIEEHLYFLLLYFRWQDKEGWEGYRGHIQETLKRGGVPGMLAPILTKVVRNSVLKSLKAQGTGRHQREEVAKLGKEHIHAMVQILGDNAFAMGEQATSLDATFYAFLTSILTPPLDSPIKQEALKHPTLQQYCERFRATYFAD